MQRDDASVAVTEHTLDYAIRTEPDEAIRLLKTQTATGSGHAESMTAFRSDSRRLSALFSKGESFLMPPISPTRFHEEPLGIGGSRFCCACHWRRGNEAPLQVRGAVERGDEADEARLLLGSRGLRSLSPVLGRQLKE